MMGHFAQISLTSFDVGRRSFSLWKNGHGWRTVRLCRCRRRLGGLRSRQPAERGPSQPGRAHRGRAARQQLLDSSPHRLRPHDVGSQGQLEILYRTRAAYGRPADLLAARPRARRLELDQRADRHPRSAAGLRPLGRARQSRLVVARRAAVFHQARAQRRSGRRPAARLERPVAGHEHSRAARAD